MSRQYPPRSPYSASSGTRRTEDSSERRPDYGRYVTYGSTDGYGSLTDGARSTETVILDDDDEDYDEDYYDDDDGYYEYIEPLDRRWIWVAGVAGAILLVAVICTVVILGGGDSGSVSKTISPPAVTTSAAASATTPAPPVATSPAPLPPPPGPLTPETVTTVSPTATASAAPAPTATAPDPRTVTYVVSGTRPLIDLVTVIYTDQQGALQTELNVALPWVRTVVLNPGVELSSVTATSVGGQLNCAITDAGGAVLAAQTNNSMIASCTK